MLCLVRTKACKRCHGDLSIERDSDGIYLECIQCGATWSEADLARPVPPRIAKPQQTVEKTRVTAGVASDD